MVPQASDTTVDYPYAFLNPTQGSVVTAKLLHIDGT